MYDPSWSMTDDDIARLDGAREMREEAELARKEAETANRGHNPSSSMTDDEIAQFERRGEADPVQLSQAMDEWIAEHQRPEPAGRRLSGPGQGSSAAS